MVDILKFLPPVQVPIPSNAHRIRERITSEQITLPILISAVTSQYESDRKTTLDNAKRWIGRCPLAPPRQTGTHEPSSISYRNFIDHEMARYYPGTTIDMSASIKVKRKQQQNKSNHREALRTVLSTGATVTSNHLVTNDCDHSSRLFGTLSKHFTIKSEPLRSINNASSNTNKSLSSWRKYWASAKIHRRQSEMMDSDSALLCSKCSQIFSTTKDCSATQNSFLGSSVENHGISRTPTNPSLNSPSAEDLLALVSDQQISIRRESRSSLPRVLSPNGESSPANKHSLIKDNNVSSAEALNMSSGIEIQTEQKVQVITTKVYKFPLPSNKPNVMQSIPKQRLRARLSENELLIPTISSQKKESSSVPNTSTKSRHQQIATRKQKSSEQSNKASSRKEQYISTVQRPRLQPKYESSKLYMPYTNVRNIPPPPPCSPSLHTFTEDYDSCEEDSYFQRSIFDDLHP